MNEYFRVFRALADVRRVRILELLCGGERCACVLLDDMEISQPTLSHHMKILCDSGIVRSRKVGRWNYYDIDEGGCRYAKKLLEALARGEMGAGLLRSVFTRAVYGSRYKLYNELNSMWR